MYDDLFDIMMVMVRCMTMKRFSAASFPFLHYSIHVAPMSSHTMHVHVRRQSVTKLHLCLWGFLFNFLYHQCGNTFYKTIKQWQGVMGYLFQLRIGAYQEQYSFGMYKYEEGAMQKKNKEDVAHSVVISLRLFCAIFFKFFNKTKFNVYIFIA